MAGAVRNNWKIMLVLIAAAALRIVLSGGWAHYDLVTQSIWGRQANEVGTLKGFYDWEVWGNERPNHPPLITWLYYKIYPWHSSLMWGLSSLGNFIALNRLAPTKFLWLFDFAKWFGTELYGTTAVLAGIIALLKQFMILADLAIAAVVYYLCRLAKTDWKRAVLVYLLLPFSWYLSSAWGQSDQLSFLFVIISFLLLSSKRFLMFSPLIYAIAANLKPNCVLLLPVYLFYWYKQKLPIKSLIGGGAVAAAFSWWTVTWFTRGDAVSYALTVLPGKLTTGAGLINFNAYNFWYIFFPYTSGVNIQETTTFLMVSAKTWGWLLAAICSVAGMVVIKYNNKRQGLLAAMFVAGFGSFLFMTGMHERYSFLAVAPVLPLSVYDKRYFKYFLILSTVFTLNMFAAYWPWRGLEGVKQIFETKPYLIPRMLSVMNVVIFVRMTYILMKDGIKETSGKIGHGSQYSRVRSRKD